MLNILATGCPFQIALAVIQFVRVLVIDDGLVLRVRDEGFSDKTRDFLVPSLPAMHNKDDSAIPISRAGAKDCPVLARAVAGQAPHAAHIRNLIETFEAHDISPSFSHKITRYQPLPLLPLLPLRPHGEYSF